MDYFISIEDPRHTPGKRHNYEKELSSIPLSLPQTISNSGQKSLFTNFITTPPVSKSQLYYPNFAASKKSSHVKQQSGPGNNDASFLNSSRNSAFTKYENSLVEHSAVYMEPPAIGDELLMDDGILRPEPRYATPEGIAQIADIEMNTSNGIIEQRAMQANYPSSRYGSNSVASSSSAISQTKRLEDRPRMKNFKDILNTFQKASDRALQQQRERSRCRSSDYDSDHGNFSRNSRRSSENEHSECDDNLKKKKQQHLRALTISIPAVGKNVRHDLPVQWRMESNGAYVTAQRSPPSPAASAVASKPSSAVFKSTHLPPLSTSSSMPSGERLQQFMVNKQRAFVADNNKRHQRSGIIPRPLSNIEVTPSRRAGPPSSSHSYMVRCASTESYNKLRSSSSRASSHSLPPSEPHSPSTETDDEDCTSVATLYEQMTGNHLELLEYASTHLDKFFRSRDLIVSKSILSKLRLSDLIYDSLVPTFSKCSTHFFDAFLPHDDLLSTAVTLMAEPVPRQFSSPVKLNCSDGNIWNPPTIVEIKARPDEEQQILRSCPRYRNAQKYRFLVIPRCSFSTVNSFAANRQHMVADENYERQISFILLQLVCALKSLQLNGIETISNDFSEFILLNGYARNNRETYDIDQLPRILLLQESLKTKSRESSIGLCDYGLRVLSTMLHSNLSEMLSKDCTLPIQTSYSHSLMECAKALQQDKSSSLTDAKNALEFRLFVGQDVSLFRDEEDAQTWIDSQRADYVNYLFREVINGSSKLNEVHEHLRLQFLLSTTSRILLR